MINFQFINDQPSFQIYTDPTCPGSGLYYTGTMDQPIGSIFRTLDEGGFPMGLKGNFAFFFYNEFRLIGAVDHLPTINLFYGTYKDKLHVSHIFRSIDLALPEGEFDYAAQAQARFYYGGGVGQSTFNQLIKRLEGGTYFEIDRVTGQTSVKYYIDVYSHHPDPSITKGDLADIFEQIIEEQTRDQFNILWSSGRDSNCVLGFVRKLNRTDRCNLISLYSDNSVTDERPNCQYLESAYGLKANYVNVGTYIGITDDVLERARNLPVESDFVTNLGRTWAGFWWESTIFQKYTGILDSGLHEYPTLTGEVGDQIFGSHFSRVIPIYLLQKPDATGQDIGEILLKFYAWRYKSASVKHEQSWLDHLSSSPVRQKAWTDAVEWCAHQWNRIDTGGDVVNRVEVLQYMFKGSHRVFNYSQMTGTRFLHPFSDYRIFHTIFRTPSHWKKSHRKTRRLSLDLVEGHVDPAPWTWWKSGIYLPSAQIFKPSNQKELLRVIGPRH